MPWRDVVGLAWRWTGVLTTPEYAVKIKVIPKKDFPVLMLFYFREFRYSRRGWENNFWMLSWSLALYAVVLT